MGLLIFSPMAPRHGSLPMLTDFFKKPYTQVTAWIVALFLATLPIFTRTYSEFDSVFLHYATILSAGGNIYQGGSIFLYPPWMAFVCIPFTWMPHLAARVCWGILNMLFLWVAIQSAWKASGFSRPANCPESLRVPVLGAICSATFFLNCISHQQFDVIIAGLVLCGVLQLTREKTGLGGILLGLGAACKMTPLLFLPYLCYRGRWKAALLMAMVFSTCNLLPDVFLGPPKEGISRFGIYCQQTLAPLLDPNFVPGTWESEIIYNQSLSGLSKRWNQYSLTKVNNKLEVQQVPPRWSPGTGKLILIGFLMGSVLLTLFCWDKPSWQSTPIHQAKIPLESGMVLCGMLLLSPMSGLAHFGILILPALNLAWATLGKNQRCAWLFLTSALAAGIALNKDLVGSNAYNALLWIALPTFGTYSLFLGNGFILRQTTRPNQDQYSSK